MAVICNSHPRAWAGSILLLLAAGCMDYSWFRHRGEPKGDLAEFVELEPHILPVRRGRDASVEGDTGGSRLGHGNSYGCVEELRVRPEA